MPRLPRLKKAVERPVFTGTAGTTDAVHVVVNIRGEDRSSRRG